VKQIAELQVKRDRRKGKLLCRIVKYSQSLSSNGKQDIIRMRYNWRINNLMKEKWARNLKQ
jgi:hypothetical protein